VIAKLRDQHIIDFVEYEENEAGSAQEPVDRNQDDDPDFQDNLIHELKNPVEVGNGNVFGVRVLKASPFQSIKRTFELLDQRFDVARPIPFIR
jgi:hypothetical protein